MGSRVYGPYLRLGAKVPVREVRYVYKCCTVLCVVAGVVRLPSSTDPDWSIENWRARYGGTGCNIFWYMLRI